MRAAFLGAVLLCVTAPLHSADPDFLLFFPLFPHELDYTGMEFDMVPYMAGSPGHGVLYEVQHSNGSQARHQTQTEADRFFHTKGELLGEWEELWYTGSLIYRGTDTSPGNGLYYTLRDSGQYGSAWAPRFWRVGEIYERNPEVTFYYKTTCAPTMAGTQRSWLRFDAHFPSYTFGSGITLYDVVRLSWLLDPDGQPVEQYFYARGYGLVGWGSSSAGSSYINEIHAPGSRPDNPREPIECLNTNGITPTGLPLPTILAK